jgi:hypothetical protein
LIMSCVYDMWQDKIVINYRAGMYAELLHHGITRARFFRRKEFYLIYNETKNILT